MTPSANPSLSQIVKIGPNISVGQDQPLLVIAGPCQIESREHCLKIAEFLQKNLAKYPINLIFKSSFDKANRTTGSSGRGLGVDFGLRALEDGKDATGLPVITGVHTAEQAPL